MKGIVYLNGFRGPNKVNKDIIKFGANGVIANGKGDGCLFKTITQLRQGHAVIGPKLRLERLFGN